MVDYAKNLNHRTGGKITPAGVIFINFFFSKNARFLRESMRVKLLMSRINLVKKKRKRKEKENSPRNQKQRPGRVKVALKWPNEVMSGKVEFLLPCFFIRSVFLLRCKSLTVTS